MGIFDRFKKSRDGAAVAESGLVVPDWLRRDEMKLPPWAKRADTSIVVRGKVSLEIEVDTNAAYEDWLALLGVAEPDQYWLEVAYQCIKLDVQRAVEGSAHDRRTGRQPIQIHLKRAEQWALSKYPPGRGAAAATKDKEARAHYLRIRGRLP